MTITDASTGHVVPARVRIRDSNGTDHVPDSNVSVLIADDVWFDPIDGDLVNEGCQTLASGDKTFTKPGVIDSEAVLYLEAD